MKDKKPTLWQRLAFVTTFYSNTLLPEVLPWHKHWHKIVDGLVLGALPIKTAFAGRGNHAAKIAEFCKNEGRPLGHVFSVVNPFEIKGEYLGLTPVSPEDWHKQKVNHTLIPMDDFGGDVDVKLIKATVDRMKKTIDSGKSVYVHCKAGKGRSFSFVVAYLLSHSDMDVTQIFALLRKQRSQVSPGSAQFKLIEKYRQAYCPQKAPLNMNSKDFQSYRKDWAQYANNSLVHAALSAIGHLVISASMLTAAIAGAMTGALSYAINAVKDKFDSKSYRDLKATDLSTLTLEQLRSVKTGMESAIEWKKWASNITDLNAGLHYACYRGGMRLQQENDNAVKEVAKQINRKSKATRV